MIGVWRWLPAYDMGVIAEIATAEAFAALRYFWISVAVIGVFIVLSLGAALMSATSLAGCSGSSAACSASARTRWNARSAKAEWRRSTSPATRC